LQAVPPIFTFEVENVSAGPWKNALYAWFCPFWFRQIRGHNLHYNTQDVWFSASFKEISKQLTGNPPRCKTQICTKLIRVVVAFHAMIFGKKFDGLKTHHTDREWSQNASLKAIWTLDKNYPLQPLATWRWQKSWSEISSLHRITLKRISSRHFDNWKKLPVCWWYESVYFHDIA